MDAASVPPPGLGGMVPPLGATSAPEANSEPLSLFWQALAALGGGSGDTIPAGQGQPQANGQAPDQTRIVPWVPPALIAPTLAVEIAGAAEADPILGAVVPNPAPTVPGVPTAPVDSQNPAVDSLSALSVDVAAFIPLFGPLAAEAAEAASASVPAPTVGGPVQLPGQPLAPATNRLPSPGSPNLSPQPTAPIGEAAIRPDLALVGPGEGLQTEPISPALDQLAGASAANASPRPAPPIEPIPTGEVQIPANAQRPGPNPAIKSVLPFNPAQATVSDTPDGGGPTPAVIQTDPLDGADALPGLEVNTTGVAATPHQSSTQRGLNPQAETTTVLRSFGGGPSLTQAPEGGQTASGPFAIDVANQPTAQQDSDTGQQPKQQGSSSPPITVDVRLLTPASNSTAPIAAQIAQQAGLQDRALEIVDRIVERARLLRYPDRTAMTMELSPPGLGRIHVQLVQDSGSFTVHMRADDPQVQQFLANHAEHLAARLSDPGHSVSVDVNHGSSSQAEAQAQRDFSSQGRSTAAPSSPQRDPSPSLLGGLSGEDSPWAPLSAQGVDYRA